jgi:hypothetical protein
MVDRSPDGSGPDSRCEGAQDRAAAGDDGVHELGRGWVEVGLARQSAEGADHRGTARVDHRVLLGFGERAEFVFGFRLRHGWRLRSVWTIW